MSSTEDESYSLGSTATSTTSSIEYSSDYIEYLSSSDEESNNVLFQDELEKKQEKRRKRNLRKYKEMCDINEEEVSSKKPSHTNKKDLNQLNKRDSETTQDIVNVTNVKIKDLEKKANIYTYNINVPKSAAFIIVNLKKRDKRNTKIICNLENPKLLHQTDTEIIVSNN